MAKLDTAGYRRWWPMRQHLGRERLKDGTRVQHAAEVYCDMVTGKVHSPETPDGEGLGWNGNPPDGKTGSKEKEGVERVDRSAYRRHYDLIDWSKG